MTFEMTPYGDANRTSGIVGYDIDPDDNYIEIEFANGGVYTYQKRNVGEFNFLKMKVLAMEGAGLNAFINKNVRNRAFNRSTEAVTTAPVNAPVVINITTTAKEASEIVTALMTDFDVKFTIS